MGYFLISNPSICFSVDSAAIVVFRNLKYPVILTLIWSLESNTVFLLFSRIGCPICNLVALSSLWYSFSLLAGLPSRIFEMTCSSAVSKIPHEGDMVTSLSQSSISCRQRDQATLLPLLYVISISWSEGRWDFIPLWRSKFYEGGSTNFFREIFISSPTSSFFSSSAQCHLVFM